MSVKIDDLLRVAASHVASDLHLKVGAFPVMRIGGELRPIDDAPRLKPEDTLDMAFAIMSNRQKQKFKEASEVDIGYGVKGLGRFRANIFQQRGTVSLVLRVIPDKTKNSSELGLPPVIDRIADERRGLILVTGSTGSGKSTTLAAMIDLINARRSGHIVTIEDPIEFLHRDKMSFVTQREVDVDTRSFAEALRGALRQDPDVILVGEMRDYETIETALTAAETGHLVLSTLHTLDATETIMRIVSSLEQCYIRPILFRSLDEERPAFGVNPFPNPLACYIGAWDWGKYLGDEAIEKGVDVCVSTWNRLTPNSMPAMAKSGANYMNSQLIKMEALLNGFAEGIALDDRGYVSEGSGENIFVVNGETVLTPPLSSSILAGITRDSVIQICQELGITVHERSIQRAALYVADELFFSGTAAEITPIRAVDRITVGAGGRGPVTERIQKAFFEITKGERQAPGDWLTYVKNAKSPQTSSNGSQSRQEVPPQSDNGSNVKVPSSLDSDAALTYQAAHSTE